MSVIQNIVLFSTYFRSHSSVTQHNGVWGVLISVNKVHFTTLVSLQGGAGVKFPHKKHYVTVDIHIYLGPLGQVSDCTCTLLICL